MARRSAEQALLDVQLSLLDGSLYALLALRAGLVHRFTRMTAKVLFDLIWSGSAIGLPYSIRSSASSQIGLLRLRYSEHSVQPLNQ